MNSIYTPESIIAPIGIAFADEDIASINDDLPIQKRIELLESFVSDAGCNIPRKIAEYLYEELHDSQPLSEDDKQAHIVKADTIRMPHRLGDLTRPEFADAVESWERMAIANNAPALVNEVPLDALLKWQRVHHHVLCNDSIAGPIMERQKRRMIDFARNKRWGRAAVQSLARLESVVSMHTTDERTVSDQKWNSLIQLINEFSKRPIDISQFIEADEVAILEERFNSISVIDLVHAIDNILPSDAVIGMYIDLGLCELNTMAYVRRLREKIEQLTNRQASIPDTTVLEEQKTFTPEKFAELLFKSLTTNELIGRCTKYHLLTICQSAGKKGKLLLRIPKGDLWCGQIAYRIAQQLGQAEPMFKVYNGRTSTHEPRELAKTNMDRTLRRKENAEKVRPDNVKAFLEEISNVTIVFTQ